MSLRDTLKAAADKAAADARFEAEKPHIIAQWQRDVQSFNAQVREWLSDYEQDGSITITAGTEEYREDFLGVYQAEWLAIRAGQYVVHIKPVGRIIFGAVGRIDMYRQGKSAENATRFIHIKNDDQASWFIRRPQVTRVGGAVMATPSEIEPLTKENFEAALDETLK